MQLGIKTEPQQPSTSKLSDTSPNEWQKEKEGLVYQIVSLKAELQRVGSLLNQLQLEFSSLSLEKEKLKEEISAKEVLLKQKEELQTLLTQLQIEFDKLKEQDANTIANLTRENKMLVAQVKQLQSGVSHRESYGKIEEKSTNDADGIDDNVYEVEKIIRHQYSREYLVRWKPFGPDDDTWEKESNLNCPTILNKYKKIKKIQ